MEIENTITEVARKYGVTPTQVKKDIGEAIRIGMASKDPTVRQ